MNKLILTIALLSLMLSSCSWFTKLAECESQTVVCSTNMQEYTNICEAHKDGAQILVNGTCPQPAQIMQQLVLDGRSTIQAKSGVLYEIAVPNNGESPLIVEIVGSGKSFTVQPKSSYITTIQLEAGSYQVRFNTKSAGSISVN